MCVYGVLSKGETLTVGDKKVFYTEIDDILTASEVIISHYNWLILDYECNYYPNASWEKRRNDFVWVPGKELLEILNSNKHLQFIWGLIVAYEKTIDFDEVLEIDLLLLSKEMSNGKNPEMRTSLGTIEIVATDSSAFSVVSRKKNFIENLKNNMNGLMTEYCVNVQ